MQQLIEKLSNPQLTWEELLALDHDSHLYQDELIEFIDDYLAFFASGEIFMPFVAGNALRLLAHWGDKRLFSIINYVTQYYFYQTTEQDELREVLSEAQDEFITASFDSLRILAGHSDLFPYFKMHAETCHLPELKSQYLKAMASYYILFHEGQVPSSLFLELEKNFSYSPETVSFLYIILNKKDSLFFIEKFIEKNQTYFENNRYDEDFKELIHPLLTYWYYLKYCPQEEGRKNLFEEIFHDFIDETKIETYYPSSLEYKSDVLPFYDDNSDQEEPSTISNSAEMMVAIDNLFKSFKRKKLQLVNTF